MKTVDLLKSASNTLAAGRRITTGQLHTAFENIANANSAAKTQGAEPYARKIAVFGLVVPDSDKDSVGRVVRDHSAFRTRYDPGSAGADQSGYVKLPNVNTTLEFMNVQSLARAYEMNMNASDAIDKSAKATLDLLK
ncbi:flagellar basal body rod C-terminal domain-containing protein [Methylobacterium brachythecii]|uniref:Flagellar basal-body rod protein FlgC n=1 Tax=Methylobacterium brachythecii TaxID=1176177 RepID=A0A7W6ACF0_9HYPH|nr:flagellar basal body rod C-terminal domain-containing protein [Methylobacterium brachythecii]MBB3900683.1 flagellar basal-body rod protein FlgC [Methylobacterium brachythecii]GLS43560.1 flagellar basal-body rod protein FlgC [Methylobacterium brachythecii]